MAAPQRCWQVGQVQDGGARLELRGGQNCFYCLVFKLVSPAVILFKLKSVYFRV